MKNHVKWTIVFLLLGIIAYLFSPSIKRLLAADGYLSARIALMYLSGTLGTILMSAAVIISARFSIVNKFFGGLDKVYEVHKLTAALGFAFGLIHFLMSFSNRMMIKYGVIPEPAHSTNPLTDTAIYPFYKAGYAFLEPAFIILIIIVAIAIIRKVPYHIFKYTHKIIPILYLQIALHAFTVPFRGGWVNTLGGYILQGMILFGAVGAIVTLFQLTGFKHTYRGTISKKDKPSSDIIYLKIKLENTDNFKFNAGQFVFLKFEKSFEAHQFSVASYDASSKELEFYIKECGDFTKKLYENISENTAVKVEGPYGEFTFQDTGKQVWIAGGIGITPFLSKINSLNGNETNNVELIYSYMGKSPFEDILVQQCAEKNVKLHIIDSQKEGLLTFDKIMELSPDIVSSTVWFCGPVMFRKVVEDGMKQNNISLNKLHFDNFSFR